MPIRAGQEAIAAAAEALARGELVGMPTETVYGLAARADSDIATTGIFAAKGRPADHPLIVHVLGAAQAAAFADHLPPLAQKLMQGFWPGPLTVIVPRARGIAAAAAGGQNTVGLRCPDHPVAQALLREAAALGVAGVAAPSANRFGRVSPTQAAHVADEFGPDLLVLDGGECAVGIESTIIDCSRGYPVMLRPGQLSRAAIEAVLGEPLQEPDAQAPRASGTLASHYAPTARVRWFDGESPPASWVQAPDQTVAVYSRTPISPQASVVWRAMPVVADEVAHELFAVLRTLDAQGVQTIWVQAPPDTPEWEGVRDRLRRAAA